MELLKLDTRQAQAVEGNPSPEKLSISVVGLGYVGAVSAACLSKLGHRVVGVDVDDRKMQQIAAGKSPIHEKDLGDYLARGVARGLIQTNGCLADAVRQTNVTFLSVGTPTAADGGCDFSYIEQAAHDIGLGLRGKNDFHVVVMRCSIPPGTTNKVMTPILERVSGKIAGRDFGVCFNPEFLREGVAIDDFHNPPKTVIGTTDLRSADIVRAIYDPVDAAPIITTVEAAEMVKYVDNVWHATKVCFANEVGRLCKPMGVDGQEVMGIFTRDHKLNLSAYYLKPGFAYGGSCLPKEVRAVTHMARAAGVDLPMINNLDASNKEQINEAVRMVECSGAKRVGILGLAFKPGTDDLRESPILEVIAALREKGVEVMVHDTAITAETPLEGQLAYVRHGSPGLQRLAKELPGMLCNDLNEITRKVDTLVVSHSHDAYLSAARTSKCRSVIDLVGLFRNDKTPALAVSGIGW